MTSRLFKGTPRMTSLLFRQQRWQILIWLVGFGVIIIAMLAAYPDVYPDEAARQGFAITVENPAMQVLIGTGYNLEDFLSVTATLFAQETLIFTLIVVGVMNIVLVSRMTRGNEEDGRTEYIRSLPVGRLTPLTSSIIVIFIVNLLLAFIIGTGLWMLNIDGTDVQSSYLYGAILGALGLVYAAITALIAQLSETERGTTMLSLGVLAVTFMIRALGDVNNDTLSLVSPLGWASRTGIFIDNHWWPIYTCLIVAIIIVAGAFYLQHSRDMDAGFLPSKPGRERASSFLKTPFGFTVHQQRISIIVWMLFLALFSGMFSTVLTELETYFADNPFLEKILKDGPDVQHQFITLWLGLLSLVSAIPATMVIMALKKEEKQDLIEHFLSKPISRTKIMSNYLFLAILTSVVIQAVIALAFWGTGTVVLDEALAASDIFSTAFVYLASIWVIIGLSTFLVGLIPNATVIAWLYLLYGFLIMFFDELLGFPDWLSNLSVFEYIPALPSEDFGTIPVILLLGISLIMIFAGLISYNKRDIQG